MTSEAFDDPVDGALTDEAGVDGGYPSVLLRQASSPMEPPLGWQQRRSSLYLNKAGRSRAAGAGGSFSRISNDFDGPDFLYPAERKKDTSLELLVHGLHLTKSDLKKMEKLTKINIHLHGKHSVSFARQREHPVTFFFFVCVSSAVWCRRIRPGGESPGHS